MPPKRVAPPPTSSTDVEAASPPRTSFVSVPKGFLPLLLYSSFFLVFPLLSEYMTYDFTTTEVRAGTIAAATVGALILVGANDCVAWFNMGLFFHIGVEVGVLDAVMVYAQADTTSTEGMVLAWVAFGIILVHLVPFLLFDHRDLLTLLAFAGVIVNTSALVFIDPTRLLLTASSSSLLLGLVLLIACIESCHTSMLSQLREACSDGTWIVCLPYAR